MPKEGTARPFRTRDDHLEYELPSSFQEAVISWRTSMDVRWITLNLLIGFVSATRETNGQPTEMLYP